MKNTFIAVLCLFAFVANAAEPKNHIVDKDGIKRYLGLKRDAKKFEAFKKQAKRYQALQGVQIPASMDLRPFVPAVANQGSCGSCWDFSLTDTLLGELMIQGYKTLGLAYNFLLNNCGKGPQMWGCNGGDFDAAQSFLNGGGPWLESQDPYTQRQGSCKQGLAPAGTAITANIVGDGVNMASFQDQASVLAARHPLSIDTAVCGNWSNPGTGIFDQNQCGASSINHMIRRLGYDCQTSVTPDKKFCVFNAQGQPINGDGYFVDRNQWGTSFGDQGDMKIRWGVDAQGHTALFFTVTPIVPPAPPEPVPVPGSSNYLLIVIIGILGSALVVVGIVSVINRKKE